MRGIFGGACQEDIKLPDRSKALSFGMALDTLAVVVTRLVLGAYIFAVLIYVNADANWNGDEDPGTYIFYIDHLLS